jgi:hypothetical protein
MERRNRNRGYQRMRVWEDAITLYVETSRRFKPPAFELKRVTGQAFKLENGPLCLIESLERKRDSGTWTETLITNESNAIPASENTDQQPAVKT